MVTRPLLLDLFAGAGGAAMGYHRAGFDVVGVDIVPQPDYPFPFVQGDALRPPVRLEAFDVVHASPPCQAYVGLASKDGRHPKLVEPIRDLFVASGLPYVIENVVGAPLLDPLRLCGSAFGLGVRRHRLFESNHLLMQAAPCDHAGQGRIRAYYGKPGWAAWTPKGANVQKLGRKPLLRGTVDQATADMGINWMDWDGLRMSIPPAYTEHIGRQLIEAL